MEAERSFKLMNSVAMIVVRDSSAKSCVAARVLTRSGKAEAFHSSASETRLHTLSVYAD
jgi:hypothetical protein